MRTTQVHKDSTDSLITYPPFEAAYLFQPSAADVRIRTNAEAMPDEGAEAACTLDTVDTTLSAAASRGATSLTLTSGTGVTRHRYYLIEDAGYRYPLFVAEVSGSTAYLAEPLVNSISNGAAFKGLAIISPALTSAQTANVGRSNLAKFRATLNGVQREFDQWFEIVRQVFPVTLSPSRLLRRGEARRMRDAADVSMMDVIQAAWEDTLLVKLRASNMLEETINTPTELEPAHIEACILHLLRDTGADEEKISEQEDRLERVIADVKASSKLRVDDSETDSDPREERSEAAEWQVASLTR